MYHIITYLFLVLIVVLLQRAIDVGADFIETDILATKDGKLICFHDVTLDALTNVVNITKFANRKRTYEVERVNVTGFFVGKYEFCKSVYNGMI